jgi:putative transposase
MAKPYSDDLRSRVADAIAQGGAYRAIADRFGLAPSTVIKWAKRLRETGSIAPAKFGGHLKCRLDAHRDFVLDRIETVPHLTLHGLKDLLAERGVTVSHDTVWRFLRREGLSFKKKRCWRLSSTEPTSHGGVNGGDGRCRISTPNASCSSTRRGSRRTWRRSAVGGLGAGGSKASRLMAAGRR